MRIPATRGCAPWCSSSNARRAASSRCNRANISPSGGAPRIEKRAGAGRLAGIIAKGEPGGRRRGRCGRLHGRRQCAMDKFKAYRIHEIEKKAVARFEDLSLEDLDPGEVVVRVAYSSVNYKDALAATGAGKIIRRFPCVGGIDLSGTVTESTDARFSRGDAVICTSYELGVARDGGYAEYARGPADWVGSMPQGMDLLEAIALLTAPCTAALAIV